MRCHLPEPEVSKAVTPAKPAPEVGAEFFYVKKVPARS